MQLQCLPSSTERHPRVDHLLAVAARGSAASREHGLLDKPTSSGIPRDRSPGPILIRLKCSPCKTILASSWREIFFRAFTVAGTCTWSSWDAAMPEKVLPLQPNHKSCFSHTPREKEEEEIEKNVTKSGNHSGGGGVVPLTSCMGKENYLLTLPDFLIYCFASCSDKRTKLCLL